METLADCPAAGACTKASDCICWAISGQQRCSLDATAAIQQLRIQHEGKLRIGARY